MESILLAENSIEVNADAESVWQFIVNWEKMPEWDFLMKQIRFPESASVGSEGSITTADGKTYLIRITEWNPPRNYTDEFRTMGSRMIFHHEVVPTNRDSSLVKFRVDGDGLAMFMLQMPIRASLQPKLKSLMQNMKRICETEYGG